MTATFRAALAVVLMALLAALAPAAVAPAPPSSSGWSWRTVYKDGFGGSKLHPAWARYDGPYGSGVEKRPAGPLLPRRQRAPRPAHEVPQER